MTPARLFESLARQCCSGSPKERGVATEGGGIKPAVLHGVVGALLKLLGTSQNLIGRQMRHSLSPHAPYCKEQNRSRNIAEKRMTVKRGNLLSCFVLLSPTPACPQTRWRACERARFPAPRARWHTFSFRFARRLWQRRFSWFHAAACLLS